MITIWPNKYVGGWRGAESTHARSYPAVDINDGLTKEYDTDAVFVPYVTQVDGSTLESCPRVNIEGLDELRASGGSLAFSVIVVDVDHEAAHAKKIDECPQWWIDSEIERARGLTGVFSHFGWYSTRGGYRLLWRLSTAVGVDRYVELNKDIRRALTAVGIQADPIKDWGRCYRLPYVKRDGIDERRPLDLSALTPIDPSAFKPQTSGVFSFLDRSDRFVLPDKVTKNRHTVLMRYAGQLGRDGKTESEIVDEITELLDVGRLGDWTEKHGEKGVESRIAAIARSVSGYDNAAKKSANDDKKARFIRGDEVEYAAAIVEDLGGESVLKYDRGELYRYDHSAGVWSAIEMSAIYNRVAGYAGELIEKGRDKNGDPKYDVVRVSSRLQEGVAKVACRGVTSVGFLDAAPVGITFSNGFVTLKNGRVALDLHSPTQRSTVATSWSFSEGATPTRFINALREMFAGSSDCDKKIAVLREFIGASLLGTVTSYQKGLILEGDGANGKSTVLQVISALFEGDMLTAIPPQELAQEYRRAMLSGARLNVVNELPEAAILVSEAVKACIAGDKMIGRMAYKDPFLFEPRAGHIFAANSLPGVRDMSRGFWRRWIVVPFRREFRESEQDRGLAQRIIDTELGVIAGWSIEGAAELARRGHYEIPESSIDALDDWRQTADSVARYISEMTIRVDFSDHTGTKASDLYARYARYCNQQGSKAVSAVNFSKRISRMGVEKKSKKTGNFYGVSVGSHLKAVDRVDQGGGLKTDTLHHLKGRNY